MWEAVLGVGDCAPDAGLAISLFGSALIAIDLVDFAFARHSSNLFGSALA